MLLLVRKHLKALCSALALTTAASCSTYDAALLAEAQGGRSVGNYASGGFDGTSTGGGPENGGTGGASNGSGGSSPDGGMGGDGSGGDDHGGGRSSGGRSNGGDGNGGNGSGGDGSGGDGSGGGCVLGDCCPNDPDKVEPGQCGCGQVDDDSDDDLTADCNDSCPNEPTKTEPGDCGCDVPASDEASCRALKDGILHRYSFSGAGAEATDSVGGQHGTIMNAGVQSSGTLTLDGIDQYVSLPAGMVSALTNATFEVWFTWNGGEDYQRIMDFGDATGSPAVGNTYLYIAASRSGEGPGSGFSLAGNGAEVETEATTVLTTGVQYHIVLVADKDSGSFSLYVNGVFQSGIAFTDSLAELNDVSCYLGRSLFEADAHLSGVIDEFRIYDVALNLTEISYSRAEGPNATILD